MQRVMGMARKAIMEYNMISDGDSVAVGVSGGKDSVALLIALARLRDYIGISYTVKAVTLDPCFNRHHTDYGPIEDLCCDLGVEYIIKRTNIGEVIFDIRKESSPCSLCARMRRGALHDTVKEYSCNKIALGHHSDDAVETFIMNLFTEGRIGCFSPVTYLSRKDITMIRPLVLVREKEIAHAVYTDSVPVVKSRCPVDGTTQREKTKQWLAKRESADNGFTKRLFGAIRRSHIDSW